MELSKKLKEVGYKQEGEFWWRYYEFTIDEKNFSNQELCFNQVSRFTVYGNITKNEWYVAPLASELMERLPNKIEKDNEYYFLEIGHPSEWLIGYDCLDKPENRFIQYDDNLCNTLAKMYIYLAENKKLGGKK